MKSFAIFILLAISISCANAASKQKCTDDDLQSCKTCDDVAHATVGRNPNPADPFSIHGTLWTPIFAAYFHNCQGLGRDLIKAGANPSIGGWFGSMSITVSNRWPHNNRQINQQWADMLILSGVSVDEKTSWGSTSRDMVANGEQEIQYPDIWQQILKSSKISPR